MRLDKRLQRWVDARLIDRSHADAILAFERDRARPYALYALGGLGALTIATGILSLVAANWGEIPALVKLALDVLALGAIAFGVERAFSLREAAATAAGADTDASGRARWLAEVGIIGYIGVFLASIALVGQTFQLGGRLEMALVFWIALSTPLAFLGKSQIMALFWLGALGATSATVLVAIEGSVPSDTFALLTSAVIALGVFGCLMAGSSDFLRRVRPAFATGFWHIGWLALIGLSSLAEHGWYRGLDTAHDEQMAAPPVLVLGALAVWRMGTDEVDARIRRPLRALAAYAVLSSLAANAIPHPDLPLLGALTFVALWLLVGFAAYRQGSERGVNLATAVLAGRMLVAYVEVFGSLATTGVGLIVSGLLTLAVAWLWMKKGRAFAHRAVARQERP